MPTDIFDLSARVTADTKSAERSLTDTQKRVIQLADQFKKLDKDAASSGKSAASGLAPLSTIISQLTPATGRMGQVATQAGSQIAGMAGEAGAAAGPIGLLVGAAVALATAVPAAAAGLYSLASAAAESAGKVYDMQQQLGLSAETLTTLDALAKTSGTSIDTLSAGIAIFEKHLGEAGADKSLDKSLRDLGITAGDTDTALRQALTAIGKMDDQSRIAAVGSQLFGRGWKSIAGVMKDADGDFGKAEARLKQLGVVLGSDVTQAADEFNDKLTILGLQLNRLEIQLGSALFPAIESGIDGITKLLADNQAQVATWAAVFKFHADGIAVSFGPILAQLRLLSDALEYLASRKFTITYEVVNVGGAFLPVPGLSVTRDPMFGLSSGMSGMSPRMREPGIGGGGGGRGGGGAKQVDEVAEALKRQTREIDEAIKGSDQYQKAIDRLVESLAKKKKAVADGQMAQLLANAETLRGIDADKTYHDFMERLRDSIDEAGHSTDQWDRMVKEVDKSLAKSHKTLKDFVGVEHEDLVAKLKLIDAMKKEVEAMQQLNITRQRYADTLRNTRPRTVGVPETPNVVDLGGGSVFFPQDTDTSPGPNSTRSRRALPDLFGEQWQQMHEFAQRITDLLSDSIHTGFQRGMKAGLLEFAQGILQMIESKVLDRLANAITDAIMKGITDAQGGGGGLISKIIGIVLGGIGGGVGGSAGTPGSPAIWAGHAMGLDYVPYDNYPALLHKGERVLTAKENSHAGANVTIQVFARDAQSFMSRDTQSQVARAYQKAIMKPALTG